MKFSAFLKSWWWNCCASILILMSGIVFWNFFLVGYIYERLRIPIGLGGAVYPMLFAVPVLAGAIAWQCIIRNRLGSASNLKNLMLTAIIPAIIAICCLFLFCPTDSETWLPGLLFRK